ncbi:nicotinate-nucleotide diphosphorylase (carboxylating), partial [archaeon]|nr:nicotinate-nucleotide diphosphorylase (carboxylating) [archaeon]
MSKIVLSKQFIQNTVKLALNEDLFPDGDITSDLLNNNKIINCNIIANEN